MTDAVHVNGGRIFAQIMDGGRVSHPGTIGFQPVGLIAVWAGLAMSFRAALQKVDLDISVPGKGT